jgi:hypothetical protein
VGWGVWNVARELNIGIPEDDESQKIKKEK